MDKARDNHYVPEWYQKRFLSSERSSFYYLDLVPLQINLPNGDKKVTDAPRWPRSPSQCFYQTDLYTTFFHGGINDEIERHLFGGVDSEGAKAVEAMAVQEFNLLHKYFQQFYEYLDIQKMRTPKGLDWIRTKYPSLSHNQLLQEMQRIRLLHCTVWSEAVREIVCAKKSKIKFLVSDHPVTIYNFACPPDSPECVYPNDPRIEMKATQTLFPLDAERCLILTNLDYARNPNLSDPKTNRPNPQPYRGTLPIRIDNTICQRELDDWQVSIINLIIKARARRFIAAENKEWLYPERLLKKSWQDLGNVLLPPKDELYHYGGEIYVGYKDGTSSYFDAYGRTEREASYLKKKPIKGKISPNDYCPCGSGKKYKKCCRDRSPEERPSTTELSIRERNLQFFEIVTRILGFRESQDWIQIRKNLTDQKIADIHKAVAALWPPHTDLMSLLPRPDSRISRALYTGLLDPRVSYKDVTAFMLYADEVLILNPFVNPNIIQEEVNPIAHPEKYRQETLKNVLFFISFSRLILDGCVNVIPDPLSFYPGFRQQFMAEVEKRKERVKIDEASMGPMKELMMEDHKRALFNLSDDHLRSLIKRANPDISKDEIEKTLVYIKKKNEQDPFAVLHNSSADEKSGQMLISHLSPNLELGMFLAQATGSFILTPHPYRWSEICSSINYFYGSYLSPWELLAKHLTNFEIDMLHFRDSQDLLEALKEGELRHMRVALRNIWNAVKSESPSYPLQIADLIKEVDEARTKMGFAVDKYLKRKNEGCAEYLKAVKTKGKLSSIVAPAGHSTSAVYRFLMAFAGHEKYMKSLPLSIYFENPDPGPTA